VQLACVSLVALTGVLVTTSPRANAATTLAAPRRLADTRVGGVTADGRGAGGGPLAADGTLTVPVVGRFDVPGDAGGVILNVTAVGATSAGFVTVFACGRDRPTASNLNFAPGRTTAAFAIAKPGDGGAVCLYTSARTDLIVDSAGWFDAGDYEPLDAPRRLADSRAGAATADGQLAGGGPLLTGAVQRIRIAGRAGVPGDARRVALNVTAADAQGTGYLTVYPCDQPRPNASNVNFVPGETVANSVLTRLDGSGEVCVFVVSSKVISDTLVPGTVHVIVDVAGTFPGDRFVPLPAPARVLDTRSADSTVDGRFAGKGRRAEETTLQLDIGGRAGVPIDAAAAVVNITVLGAKDGFLTAHPPGAGRPLVSNLNYAADQTVANTAIVGLGGNGRACLFNHRDTHVIVDVVGWIRGTPAAAGSATCPDRSLIPAHTLVALYGNDSGPALGALGEQSPEQAAIRLAGMMDEFRGKGRPVIGAFEFIATVAQASPGPGSLYRARTSDDRIRAMLAVARANGLQLVLDIQPGRSDFVTEVKAYEQFWREPDVHVGLDPEWRVGPNSIPAVVVGSVRAAEVNEVTDYIAKIVADNDLPDKLVVIHQFQIRMLPDRDLIVARPRLNTMFHMDGFGSPAEKLETWRFVQTGPPFFNGFKLFYDEDRGMFTPSQTLGLTPRPDLVTYQ
jgi:hypothetical protein